MKLDITAQRLIENGGANATWVEKQVRLLNKRWLEDLEEFLKSLGLTAEDKERVELQYEKLPLPPNAMVCTICKDGFPIAKQFAAWSGTTLVISQEVVNE